MRIYVAALVAFAALVAVPSASALDIEDLQLPDAVVGTAFKFQLDGEKGCEDSHHFAVDSGYLPPGLVLSREGLLSGTPTTPGRYDFFVQLTDDCNSLPSEGKFDIHVLPALVLTTPSLAPTLVGRPYSATLFASGGNGPLLWSISEGPLPPGLTLDGEIKENATLSGTPTAVGTYTFKILVQDLGRIRSSSKQFTFVVAAPVAVTAPVFRPSEVGVPFTATPATSGGAAPLAWSVARGSLPAGLALNPATGAITGTPAASGSFPLTLAVTDGAGSGATVELTLAIAPRLAISTAPVARAKVGRPYRARLAFRGGVGAVTWRLVRGALPRGIQLNTKTGVLAGTARKAGTYRVTVMATDALGAKASRQLALTVLA